MNDYIDRYLNASNSNNPKYSGWIQYDIAWVSFSKRDRLEDLSSPEYVREAALYLSNYLACWGMYRGSSKLKETNTYFLEDLIKLLLTPKTGLLIPLLDKELGNFSNTDKPVIKELLGGTREFLKAENVSPTCTLVSKILLLLWGQVPAYDRYFKSGLGNLDSNKIPKTLNQNSIVDVSNWFREQKFNTYYTNNQAGEPVKLPNGKIADMAIFQLGVEGA